MEVRPKSLTREPTFLKPSLEIIPQVNSSTERRSEPIFPSIVAKSQHEGGEALDHAHIEKLPLTTINFGDEIPKLEETIAREMWDVVH